MTTKGLRWRIKSRKRNAIKPPGRANKERDPLAAHPMLPYMNAHLEWAGVKGFTPETVGSRRLAIRRFITWCDERGLKQPTDVSKQVVERYQRHLFYYRKPDGKPITTGTQIATLSHARAWFRWLARENHILFNPASELELPRRPRQLPRVVLSWPEVESLLAEADVQTPSGLRDRAMLELLYSSALRRTEVTLLAVYDLDLDRRLLMVREGKGRKDRMVPVGARATVWLDKYLLEARPKLLAYDHMTLFVSDYGEPVKPAFVAARVRTYLDFAGINKPGATHLLRHACATHMLEGGADIRFIQALLGHENLETTEIYTHVAITKLQAIHDATHPARLRRPAGEPVPAIPEAAQAALAVLLSEDGDEAE